MAVFSALKNKKNQKMREGIEDLALKCAESGEKDDNIQVSTQCFFYEDYVLILIRRLSFLWKNLSSSTSTLMKRNFQRYKRSLIPTEKLASMYPSIPLNIENHAARARTTTAKPLFS